MANSQNVMSSDIHASPVVAQCLGRIQKRYSVVAAILVQNHSSSSGVITICAIIAGRGSANRARFRFNGERIDVFIASEENILDQLAGRKRPTLNRLFASGTYVCGDRSLIEHAIRCARENDCKTSDIPAPLRFRSATQPFDLLRSFHAMRGTDRTCAALCVQNLIGSCLDALLARHKLWIHDPAEVLNAIRTRDSRAADLLANVLDQPITLLCESPELLDAFVRYYVGAEPPAEELWVDRGPAPPAALSTAPVPYAMPIDLHPAAHAIRSYEANRRIHDRLIGKANA